MIVWEGMAVIEEKYNMEISCEAMNDILSRRGALVERSGNIEVV